MVEDVSPSKLAARPSKLAVGGVVAREPQPPSGERAPVLKMTQFIVRPYGRAADPGDDPVGCKACFPPGKGS